jgi:hypothetical protein
MHQEVTKYPLTWPLGWKRTTARSHSKFGTKRAQGYGQDAKTIGDARDSVLKELRAIGVRPDAVSISSNLQLRNDGLPLASQSNPADPGVAVWWQHKGKQHVVAIDNFFRAADNLYAIAKTLEAMRGIKRWGSGEILERTYASMTPALPNLGTQPWYDVFKVKADAPREEVEAVYKRMRVMAHPDKPTGDEALFKRIMQAWYEFCHERSL